MNQLTDSQAVAVLMPLGSIVKVDVSLESFNVEMSTATGKLQVTKTDNEKWIVMLISGVNLRQAKSRSLHSALYQVLILDREAPTLSLLHCLDPALIFDGMILDEKYTLLSFDKTKFWNYLSPDQQTMLGFHLLSRLDNT
jgi:hypothetical protein